MTDPLKAIKRKIAYDWRDAFPEITMYSPSKFYKIVGPTIIGIELIKSPHLAKEYRAYFHCYPLWRESLKKCLDYPEVLIEIKKASRRQFFVPYDKHDLYFSELCECVRSEIPLSFEGDLRLSNFNDMVEKYALMPPLSASPNSYHQARLRAFQFYVALYLNADLANQVLQQISQRDWNVKHFLAYGIDVEKWLEGMDEALNYRERFLHQIETNRMDGKLKKLKRSELTM